MISSFIQPIVGTGALEFAFSRATTECKFTLLALLILSFLSWTIIISKSRQLFVASRQTRKFLAQYGQNVDPLKVNRDQVALGAAPAFQVFCRGAGETERLLLQSPVAGQKRINEQGFELIKTVLEETTTTEAINLERGMIILSIAVAGGPFIGLLGTVWGVMETFSGIAQANAATLTAMAPGVAAALIATVAGLLVAIPAMFAYNLMVTSIRHITQELDAFAARFATQIRFYYMKEPPVS